MGEVMQELGQDLGQGLGRMHRLGGCGLAAENARYTARSPTAEALQQTLIGE